MKNCLNLGCGTKYIESTEHENWVNVDIDPNVKTDWCGDTCKDSFHLVHSNMFDFVYAHHSLEHFDDLFSIMDILGIVCRDGAEMEIITPYCTWTQGWGNPHHHILFHENTFRFFDKGKNGIHKRRDQDYSIETVSVEYGWNDDFDRPALDIDLYQSWESCKIMYLNVVRQITFKLRVSK